MQAIAKRRDIGGSLDLHAADGRIVEGPPVDAPMFQRRKRLGALDVGGSNIEMRTLPIIAYQKSAALLEPTIEMHDGDTPPPGRAYDSITRLENEASYGRHTGIVPQVSR